MQKVWSIFWNNILCNSAPEFIILNFFEMTLTCGFYRMFFCIITEYQFLYKHNEWDIYFRSSTNEPFFCLKRKMTNNCDEAEDLWSTSGAVCEAEVVQAVAAIERPLLLCVWLAEDGFSFLCFCLAAVAASWECCKINSSWRHSCWPLVSAYCLRGRRLGSATRGGGWAPSPCLAHALCCKLKGECGEITHTPKTGRGYSQRECTGWME